MIDTVAIGGFDGMHRGHQELFARLGKNGAIVAIETGYANLTPQKYRQIYSTHPIHYLELDAIRELEGREFVEFLSRKFRSLKRIVVGYDFCFGKDRKYCIEDLREFFDGDVEVVDEVCINGEAVHSRVIREYIRSGDIKRANTLLAHNYTIWGELVKGQGLGKKELYATLNLSTEGFLLPYEGVYATLTRVDEILYPSVSFVGKRVSTDGSFAIESHILDHEISCQNGVAVSFVAFIRENRKFDDLDLLKKAIGEDIKMAKKELGVFRL